MKRLHVHREECDDVPKGSIDRTLCEVAHYTTEYEAPASKADIAYELGKTPRTEPCIVGAVNRGSRIVDRNLPGLLRRGLVKKTKYGGFVLSARGRTEFGKVARKYDVHIHD